jgi:hypothetical protein
MSQRRDDFYADLGQFGASDELRPVYERLDADARAWSVTVGDETPLIAFARLLPRRSREETMRMQSQPGRPEWDATQRRPYSNPDYQPQQRPSRARTWVAVIAATLVVALLGGSFYLLQASRNGGTTGMPTATTAQATNTPLPTATAAATPLPTASASQLAACGMTSAAGVWRLGDLLVVGPTFTNVAYPSRKLPDGTSLAPLALQAGSELDTQLPLDPATNPYMAAGTGGFELFVCNSSSSKTHAVNSVSARIESAIAYAGALSQWNLCDGRYDASTRQPSESGCGGGFCANETMNALFAPNAAVGATVTTTQQSSDRDIAGGCSGPIVGPLPVSLKPLHSFSINIGIVAPTRAATYTWAFGLSQDSAAPIYLPATRLTLLAPVAHKWTGAACLQPTMQSQIPAASSPTYYICPES